MTPPAAQPLLIDCAGDTMVGIAHPGDATARLGVVIVVGGPQYRVGSHRQFLLLARALAAAGIPSLRFDYRGLGDSDGTYRGFESIGPDIRAAIDAFAAKFPQLEGVILWGLCDAASAILFYAGGDPRVAAIALLNPWVRTETGLARAHLRHHYLSRLADRAFWRRLITGGVSPRRAVSGFFATVGRAIAGRDDPGGPTGGATLPERMARGFRAFRGPVLLIISGQDLTAREFEDATRNSREWRGLHDSTRVCRRDLPDADHTFSRRAWRDQVAAWTIEWIREC